MSGFDNTYLNRQIATGMCNHIIAKVLECLDLMRQDCEHNKKKLANNETTIRDYLYWNYLNNDALMRGIGFDNFRFDSEVPENYVDDRPIGRVDLRVISFNDFRHRDRYFIIECKRIDGNSTLNREYIKEGIRRFIGNNSKYTSYYKMNCILGFVVRNIDIDQNVDSINSLLKSDYLDINVQSNLHPSIVPSTYISVHGKNEDEQMTLIHAFSICEKIIY